MYTVSTVNEENEEEKGDTKMPDPEENEVEELEEVLEEPKEVEEAEEEVAEEPVPSPEEEAKVLARLERERRRYVRKRGGFRKDLSQSDARQAGRINKKLGKKKTDGWDFDLLPDFTPGIDHKS